MYPANELYRFSHDPMSRRQKDAAIRTLKADVFALSQRKLVKLFHICEYSLRDMAKKMNELGMLNQTGGTWTFTNVQDLCLRLGDITEKAIAIDAANQKNAEYGFYSNEGEDKEEVEDAVLDALEIDLLDFLTSSFRAQRGLFCGIPSLE